MQNTLLIIQSILATIIVTFVLLQTKGTGFGRSWGGGSASFTRRGLEKLVFRSTFVVTALFLIVSILQIII